MDRAKIPSVRWFLQVNRKNISIFVNNSVSSNFPQFMNMYSFVLMPIYAERTPACNPRLENATDGAKMPKRRFHVWNLRSFSKL